MKVSVLMPSFNYARYLSRSIESVLTQTHADLELIITDDCSTDGSRDITEDWSHRDKRVVPVFHKVNGGLAVARNSGLAVASGSFVALCDADDIWLPDKLKIQLERFDGRPQIGLVHSDTTIIDSDGKLTGQRFSQLIHKKNQRTSGNLFDELCERNFLCVPTVVMRREALDYAGGFDASLRSLEDWICFTRISRKYGFDYVQEPLAHYRIHGASLSRNSRGMNENRVAAVRRLLDLFPDLPANVRSGLLYRLGRNSLDIGDAQGAVKAFRGSIQADTAQLRSWLWYFRSTLRLLLFRG